LNDYQEADYWKDFWCFVGRNLGFGDVTGEGETNVDDVSAIIETLLGNSSNEDCDINNDGDINVTDASDLIDYLLGNTVTESDTVVTKEAKKPIKILHLGNSYADDQISRLRQIFIKSGSRFKDFIVFEGSRGSGSFKNWVDILNGVDNSTYILRNPLTYRPIYDGVKVGRFSGKNNTIILNLLKATEFDIIVLQQVSTYATKYDLWNGRTKAGYLDSLITLLRQYQPNAKIALSLSHTKYHGAYASGNTYDHWQATCEAAKKALENGDVDMIVPYGTAIENLRQTRFNNEESDLTRDGQHLGYDLARYTAAACWYQTLIAPYSGNSVINNPARCKASSDTTIKYRSSSIAVDDTTAPIALRAAVLAADHPFECINPE